jgi:hypothetical protein
MESLYKYLNSEVFEHIASIETSNVPKVFKNSFKYENIIEWRDLENYLNNPYSYLNNVEFISDSGSKILPSKAFYPYCGEPRYLVSQVFEMINKDYSFILLNMNRFSEKLNQLSAEIENNLKPTVDLDFHLYCGLGNQSQSFYAHSDVSHNIIMQVDGECDWKVYNCLFDGSIMLSESGEVDLELVIDETLSPGDAIYIPQGVLHKCLPKSKRISISSCWQVLSDYDRISERAKTTPRTWHTFKH